MGRVTGAMDAAAEGGWARRLGLVVLAVVGVAGVAPHALGQQGKYVAAEPAVVDFGDVAPGASVVRTVVLRNVGHFPVHVRSVRPSCECTAAKVPMNTLIDPNGTLELTLTFSAKQREGPQEPNVVVVFAEGIPPLRVDGKANVNRGIRFETVRTPAPDGGEIVAARLEGAHGQAFRVVEVNGDPPRTPEGAEGSTSSSASHLVRIDGVGASGSTFPGSERWVAIETDDPDSPVVVVPAPGTLGSSGPRSWTIAEPLRVLGLLTPGKDETLEVLLTGVRGSPLEAIERIEVEARGAEAGLLGIEPSPSGMNARLYIRASAGASGLVAASLRITVQGHTEILDVFAGVADGTP